VDDDHIEIEEVVCSEYRRVPHPGENPDDEWRAESDRAGEPLAFCPEWLVTL
jgi:hypothetical protein